MRNPAISCSIVAWVLMRGAVASGVYSAQLSALLLMAITLCNPHRIMFESVRSRLHSSARATKLLRAPWLTRALLAAAGTACLCAQAPAVQGAEGTPWPARPIRLVVPFVAGTFVDVISRIVG